MYTYSLPETNEITFNPQLVIIPQSMCPEFDSASDSEYQEFLLG